MIRITRRKRWPILLAGLTVLLLAAACTPRPFSPSSPWNSRLGAVGWRDAGELHNGHSWVNFESSSIPVVWGKGEDPVVAVNVPASWGWPASTLQLHIPNGVGGAAGSDGTLVVVDNGVAYDLYQFSRSGPNSGSASAWAASLFSGSGWGRANPFLGGGIRAAGSSSLGGLITLGDFLEGDDFRHALAVSMLGSSIGGPVPPAIASDGGGGPIPMGARLGIPAGTPMPGGLTGTGVRMWNTLVRYGAFVVDQHSGSAPVIFYADPRSVGGGDVANLRNPGGDLDKIMPYVRVVA